MGFDFNFGVAENFQANNEVQQQPVQQIPEEFAFNMMDMGGQSE